MQKRLANKELLSFGLKLLLFFISWFVFYEFIGKKYIDPVLTYWVTHAASSFMSLFQSGIEQELHATYSTLILNGKALVDVGDACNGLVLYPIFIGFLFLLPGSAKKRLIFIAIGSLTIFFVNMLRVIALATIFQHWPEYLEFNHRYTFTIFVYSVIFLLWIFYVKSISPVKNKD